MGLTTYRLDMPSAFVESVLILAESEAEALAIFNAASMGHQDAINRVAPCRREVLYRPEQMRIRSAVPGTPEEKQLICERVRPVGAVIQMEAIPDED